MPNESQTPLTEWWEKFLANLGWHTITVPMVGEVLVNQKEAIKLILAEHKKRIRSELGSLRDPKIDPNKDRQYVYLDTVLNHPCLKE